MRQNKGNKWFKVQASGFMFHLRNFFYPFRKKIFLNLPPWNMEHLGTTRYYSQIATLIDDFLFQRLWNTMEQIFKRPIKATFLSFFVLEQCIK
jgi:hypothetical protein